MPKITSFAHGPKISICEKLENKIFNGYCYVYSKGVGSTKYFVCREKTNSHCPGRGKIVNGQFFMLTDHNHIQVKSVDATYAFKKALYTAIINNRLKSVKSVYNEISLLHPEAATIKTWKIMEPRMRRWRTQIQPPIPQNLQQYQKILDDPRWIFLRKNYDKTSLMHVSTSESEDKSYVTIFGNRTLLQIIKTPQLFMDATFKIVPKKPQALQFFTILALVNNTVSAIPIFWSLMEKKSSSAYRQVLKCFTLLVPDLVPNIIISDFEAALSIVIEEIYPGTLHKRCFFHYCQALMKKWKKLQLLPLIQRWKIGRILSKKFFALALLPADKIEETFQWLINNIPESIKKLFEKFIKYYERQWINRIQPDR
ncbi:LOW QUALITY PROTEIN: uncharacterized protein, partial [Chelonus insularis]|uniref:LOW QUALITY PROTEIN: uncharacterized protein n=1 Tax=Chelonus insularis TaxID=460826 RepID=UPI00158D2FEA